MQAGGEKLLSLCSEFPPRQGFSALKEMLCRHQGIEHAGIVAFSHPVREQEISGEWIACGKFGRCVDAEHVQIARNRFADVGDVFQFGDV